MQILMMQHTPRGNYWVSRPVDLDRVPREGEFIVTGETDEGEWFLVRAVAQVPSGHKVAAKIVVLRMTEADVRQHALPETADVAGSHSFRNGELLTEVEAATLAKVSRRTIRRLIEKGKLAATNYGLGRKRSYRVSPDALAKVQPVEVPPPPERRRRLRYQHSSEPVWPPARMVPLKEPEKEPMTKAALERIEQHRRKQALRDFGQ